MLIHFCVQTSLLPLKNKHKKTELPQKHPLRVFRDNSGNLVSRIRIRGSVVTVLIYLIFRLSETFAAYACIRFGAALHK